MTSVYAIRAGNGAIKIGVSKDPKKRLASLSTAMPFDAELAHTQTIGEDARAVEAAAHNILKAKRLRGEWFDVTEEEAVAAIAEAITAINEGRTTDARDEKSTAITVRLTSKQAQAVDNWRRDQSDIPGRPEAIRRLIWTVI